MKQKEELLGAIARGWCSPKNSKKTMDSDLVVAIEKEVYNWHITQQIKLLEEVKKECVYQDTDGVHAVLITRFDNGKLNSLITNLKEK